ncbi:MAG: hypothetical protein R3D84_07205 [Paracoccaceae bacterium]
MAGGPVRRHWQGRLPVWLSFWLVLIAGRVALWALWRLVPVPLAALLPLIALDAAILVWQSVGAWRALGREYGTGAQVLLLWTAEAGVLAIAALSTVLWLDLLAGGFYRTPAPPPAPEPLTRDAGAILIDGPIDYALLARFDATPRDRAERVILDSSGGLIYAARALASRVETAGLATEVRHECLSACTLVFLAGRSRDLAPGARLGFHGYRLASDVPTLNTADEERRDHDWMAARGVTQEFLSRIADTSPDTMWFPDRAALVAGGVLER